jgi:DGQHR domain-containing protein
MHEREMDTYLGIQREVSQRRVKEIGQYVNTPDACFPSAVILAVEGRCAEFDEASSQLTLRTPLEHSDNEERINIIEIARVLDGQHRIEGLQHLASGVEFDINVSIFVDMDIENQAYLFSVVNLAQTKVNRSLAYDLFDYAKARSPQKSAHNIAVALDKESSSPLFQRVKRLGVSTKGRFTETITQATVVEALLKYISADPIADRSVFLKGSAPKLADADTLRKQVFRNMFLQGRDLDIADVLFNYFSAARERWPRAWDHVADGAVLSKTNGFRALMRILRPAYLHVATPGQVVGKSAFAELFARSRLDDSDFNTDRFKPGSSGESNLYRTLLEELRV